MIIPIPLWRRPRGMFISGEMYMKKAKKSNRYAVRTIIRSHRWQILCLSILAVLQSIAQVLLAIVIKYVIDAALSNGNLLLWGGVLAANLLALVLFHITQQWYSGTCVDNFTAKLRQDLLHAAAYSRDSKLQSFHSGELLSRAMEDVSTVSSGVLDTLPMLAGQVTRLLGSFAAVVALQPVVALILVVMAIAMAGAAGLLRPMAKRCQRKVRITEEAALSNLQEDFQQLELIQSLQAQEQIEKRFDKRTRENLKEKLRRRRWVVGGSGGVASASYLGTGAVILWGAMQLAAKTGFTYGDFTSIIELLALFRGPVLNISSQWNKMMAVEVSCERLLDMLKEETETDTETVDIDSVEAVVFENVTFGYPGEETAVVENFSASFPLTGWTCLTGISGKGKTTLFKLMLGLYTPQQGRVYLKTSAGEVACSVHTRHLFAYVPQDYAMLSGTVLENLQLVAPDVTEEEYKRVLKLADADFVWDTAAGVQTHLGENNTGLSKGQLQRLAIARAVLMDRKIFLLDECTSALDAQTEDTVLHNLKKLNKSAILVTHRPQAVEELENVTFVPMDQ